VKKFANAAVMTQERKPLEIVEYPLPEIQAECVLVKIDCCTICGSDIHSWIGRRKAPVPIILGHEIVGTIAEIGPGQVFDSFNRRLKVGDRITWTIMDNCGKCYYCRQKGLMMKCKDLKKYGHDSCEESPHFTGGFAEYCYLTPGTCIVSIPDHVSSQEAAPANCALATITAAWEEARIKPVENVLIQGAGALGFYLSAYSRHNGCSNIIVTDIEDFRLEMIQEFGATHTINVRDKSREDIVSNMQDLTNGFGVDCVFEVAGRPELIPLGLDCLRTGGRLIEVGNSFPNADFKYDACKIVWRRLSLIGVHNYDARHLQQGVTFLAEAKTVFPFHKIATHTVGLDDINTGLELAQSRETIRVAVLP
jgi:alcohol dehydrogenase